MAVVLFHSMRVVALLISLSLFLTHSSTQVNSDPVQDKQALLEFRSKVPHKNSMQWNENVSACSWVGITCDPTHSFVHSLRLPAARIVGQIPPNILGKLSQLRYLSLRSNRLSGQIPADISNLTSLRCLYLQSNEFAGEFPPSVTRLTQLVHLDLSSNKFSGQIPFNFSNLTRLTSLLLENNSFSGNLPSIYPANLTAFSVANNNLNGSIPAVLSKFPKEKFSGNPNLYGAPLQPPNLPSRAPSPTITTPPPTGPTPKKKSNNLSRAEVAAIAGGSVAGGSALIASLLFVFRFQFQLPSLRRRKSPQPSKRAVASRAVPVEAGTSSSKDDISGGSSMEAERNKLVFFQGGVGSFDLEDLRASAEVLGKGNAGTSHKVVLEEGTTVVVKRFKDVVVSKREFVLQMEALGKIKHDNVVPLRAFYFSKDEKLLVSDYMAAGSLSALLHGSRGSGESGRTPLDWDNRMRIAISAARGISHLHVSGKVVHGNIKSSNILLRPDQDTCVSDYGLNPLFGTSTPPNRAAGYRAPEVVETRKVTYKSDVYSFGVLLLELLTGKAPKQASLGEEGIDLPRWVQSVVREEWTAKVFDVELMRYHNIEEEMVQLLQIAMACVSTVPDQRPAMGEVVWMIEEINRSGDADEGLRQTSDDPSKGSDGQTPPSPTE